MGRRLVIAAVLVLGLLLILCAAFSFQALAGERPSLTGLGTAGTVSLPQPQQAGHTGLGASSVTCEQWRGITTTNAPIGRYSHTAVWTGSEMLVWGGSGSGGSLNTGGRYNPATDTWTPITTTDAPSARRDHTAVWTGSEMLVWGGSDGSFLNSGGRYNPAADSWTPITTTNAPDGRELHTTVWTGSEMLVWGGSDGSSLNSGGRYDPSTDTWTPITTANAPSARRRHSAVWTGSEMLVWGGYGSSPVYKNDGARYDPGTDTWAPIATASTLFGRYNHTAVWTGSEMLIWGGFYGINLNDGGRYDPSGDTWTPITTTNAPSARNDHTAVWTGSEMWVWGGSGDNTNSGGRYNPSTDIWTPMTITDAPTARVGHTTVWTGGEMLVWGGYDGTILNSGGRYSLLLHIASHLPLPHQVGVALHENIHATFDCDVNASTVTNDTFVVHGHLGGMATGTFGYDGGSRTVTLDPDRTFHTGEVLRVSATSGISSTGGDPLMPYGWQFTAGDVYSRCLEGFTDINATLIQVEYGSIAWGDYDNDGDLDILLTGRDNTYSPVSKVYRNDSGAFTDISAALVGVYYSSVAWGDYDNDGDLDILLTGSSDFGTVSKVYRNEGVDSFVDIGAGLTAVYHASVAWGDYDNDGDLDILLTGFDNSFAVSKVYRNDGPAGFADISAGLVGVYVGSAAWGDCDRDGDLDILLTGRDSTNSPVSKLYRNDGAGTFADIGAGLTGVEQGAVAWGDYDKDGDLDILLTGYDGSIGVSKVYRNDGGGAFTDIGAGLLDVSSSSVAWGDYDNDGDLDILLTGYTGSAPVSKLYRNDGGAFSDIGAGLTPVWRSSVAWGDVDNDGDLDILLTGWTGSEPVSKIYRNDDCPDLVMSVNYAHDWVEGDYPAGHTVWIDVTDDLGSPRASAEMWTQEIPWWGGATGFSTNLDDPWVPGRPDIQPYDYVFGAVDNGRDGMVQIGDIGGVLDLEADTVSGEIFAPFTEPLYASCAVWEDGGPWRDFYVDPSGGFYSCNFGEMDWNLVPGDDVAVSYQEPDGDWVINMFREPAPDVWVHKWPEGSQEAAPGGPVVYTIQYRNEGDGVAETIWLTDTLPADTSYVADSSGVAPSFGVGWVSWELGPLDPGEEERFQVVLQNWALAGTWLTNQVEVHTLYDENPDNNFAESWVEVIAGQPDVWVDKWAEPWDPAAGETYLYHIDYGNNAAVDSGPVFLTETLPLSTTLEWWGSANGYGLWSEVSYIGSQLVLQVPSVPGYWGDTLLLRVRVDGGVPEGTQLRNEVQVATPGDTDPGNDWSMHDAYVSAPRWDAAIEKRLHWAEWVPGGPAEYWIWFSNVGNMPVHVWLTDTLPSGTDFSDSWQWMGGWRWGQRWPDHMEDGIVAWDMGVLQPGDWSDMTLSVAVGDGVIPGTVVNNCIEIGIDGLDQNPDDNHSCVESRVSEPGPNLHVEKSYWWDWEGQLRYQIRLWNVGTEDLTGVTVIDTYPLGTTWNGDWWWSRWSGYGIDVFDDADNRQLIFSTERIEMHEPVEINFRVDLDAELIGAPGLAFVNTVEAPIAGDVDPEDNQAQVVAYSGPPCSQPSAPSRPSPPQGATEVGITADLDWSELDGRWWWENEDPVDWSLSENPGHLRIMTHPGWAVEKNLLLQDAPMGTYTITTRVHFTPTSNYQTAGLVLYQDPDNYLTLVRAYCDSPPPACVGDGIYFDLREGGAGVGSNYPLTPTLQEVAYLRVVHEAGTYSGFYSEDGIGWTLLGSHTPTDTVDLSMVGLGAGSDLADLRIPADFCYFWLQEEFDGYVDHFNGATWYDVYFGTTWPPSYLGGTTNSEYPLPTLNEWTQYFWQVVAWNDCGEAWGDEWDFGTGANHRPALGTVDPPSGSGPTAVTTYFTTTWTDADGWEDLKQCYFHIGDSPSIVGNVTLMYNAAKDKLWMRSDDGTMWFGGYAPGSANTMENSQAIVYCSLTTVQGAGDTLAVKWAIEFKPGYEGAKKTGLKCKDRQKARAKAGWKGAWLIY